VLTVTDARGKDAPNTTLYREQDGTLSIILHRTAIIRHLPDGTVCFTSGGYQTATTKDRLNRFAPKGLHFSQKDFAWFWQQDGFVGVHEFEDGMTLRQDHDTHMWERVR
jgi:hypothetical protein